ncbi:hypothetical protein G5I_04457 [Acromyrmex echinatior]|uniref:Uncharacterized protein n=1 Tax=Acromyrmex echinatior TaxID=103372 RepID=F4WFP8_ACREC|nr:hypothetical protein G5I_04457 [Acromyrmex echinatior]
MVYTSPQQSLCLRHALLIVLAKTRRRVSKISLDSSIPEYLVACRSSIFRVRVGMEEGRGKSRARRKANYRIIAFNCDSRYLRNGAAVEARDCRRVPNYWMLTSPAAAAAAAAAAVEIRCGTALLASISKRQANKGICTRVLHSNRSLLMLNAVGIEAFCIDKCGRASYNEPVTNPTTCANVAGNNVGVRLNVYAEKGEKADCILRVVFAGGQTAETRIARILLSLAAITFDTRHAAVIALGQAERREREEIMKSTDTDVCLQIGAVHAHQPNNNHHQQQQQQQQQSSQPQVPGAGAGGAGGPGGGVARAGGMFCYHCPPGLPAPRLPPSLEYPFAPTHPSNKPYERREERKFLKKEKNTKKTKDEGDRLIVLALALAEHIDEVTLPTRPSYAKWTLQTGRPLNLICTSSQLPVKPRPVGSRVESLLRTLTAVCLFTDRFPSRVPFQMTNFSLA